MQARFGKLKNKVNFQLIFFKMFSFSSSDRDLKTEPILLLVSQFI